MATVEEQLAALALRVEALEAANGALRAQLEEARRGIDLTMRGQGRCRACGASNILHAATVAGHGSSVGAEPLAVSVTSFLGRPQGTFEAYICVGCGAVEWYVKDPPAIERGKTVNPVTPRDGGGSPYR